MTITETVADYVDRARLADFPVEVIERAKYHILDSIGCALGGYQTDVGKMHVDLAKDLGGTPQSPILGDGAKVSSVMAAYTNAALAMVLDFNDHLPAAPSHIGSPTVQSALAVGAARRASGEDLLTAVLVAYEVAIRVGRATGMDRTADIPHAQINLPFGAAVAASKLLGLDREQIIDALGIMVGRMRGNPMRRKAPTGVQPTNLTIKSDRGFNAVLGVLAALQAEKGHTGKKNVLDSDGFWQAGGADGCRFEELTMGLGETYRIMEMEFKPWPCCRTCHTPITAVMEVLEGWPVKPEDIQEIRLRTFLKLVGYEWETMMEAEFVCPCAIAMAVMSGEPPGPRWYTTGRFRDPDVRDFARRITYEFDVEAEALRDAGKRICTATIITKDGQSRSARIESAKGRPDNPMTPAELEDKFRANADSVLSQERIGKVLGSLADWESLEDITALTDLLHGG
jgi:2-methylcitrate dehydratase PrpD